ncbi:glycosyltransferase [Sediminibacterium sp.]|uniref:glycosyltransferase n=1 Tax=Sediminibacterium sp. TaxID=1917865 RepID=UPI0027319C34|nr:glycosyltransferase [Sediminibacterium sp.]MDP2422121.1 glycosyltransferase [Sediminibacterium sp.]
MEALLDHITPITLKKENLYVTAKKSLPIIVMITSYPPRECGIATYANDLYNSLNNKFDHSFSIHICALEQENTSYTYSNEVKYTLDTSKSENYNKLALELNTNELVQLIIVQHEFGFYNGHDALIQVFLESLSKPVIIALHTVLRKPSNSLKAYMQLMLDTAIRTIVMTKNAATILIEDYAINPTKIEIISHGTHLVKHTDKIELKKKYGLTGRKILSTFGLLNSGKSIETTIDALTSVIKLEPTVLFLIIGITHPGIIKKEGEAYRNSLQEKINDLAITKNVLFINEFLELPALLDYLQLTDIYLFTSNNPDQAVSGTFSYAISSGCPIIATAIPHALEVLANNTGIIVDFNNSQQLSTAILTLLSNDKKREEFSANGIHKLASTAWENSALKHLRVFKETITPSLQLNFSIPPINLHHLKKLTTQFGIIQFAILNKPDLTSGYTLDDNARALIAMGMYFEITRHFEHLYLIEIYLEFIAFCQQENGRFLNYVSQSKEFTNENEQCNLDDANGRAVWALGYMIGLEKILPLTIVNKAKTIFDKAISHSDTIHSTRAMAFIIKGCALSIKNRENEKALGLIELMADRIYRMYLHESTPKWKWYESYLTYANSLLPEAMLYAWKATGIEKFKITARDSFQFLLSQIFTATGIHVISNKHWHNQDTAVACNLVGGEQPIDVAYTILSLNSFNTAFEAGFYKEKIKIAFDWFQGRNHLDEIIYNPCTGGCYDGLEDSYVNLNQGAESTLSYLMARLTIDHYDFSKP